MVLAARRENRLREVAEKCMQRGARDAVFLKTDVSKLEDCEKLINFAVDTFGRSYYTYSVHLRNVFDRTFCYVQFPGLLFLKSLLSMLEDSDFVDVVSKRAAKGFIVAPKSELLTRG